MFVPEFDSPLWTTAFRSMMVALSFAATLGRSADSRGAEGASPFPVLSDAEAWKRLPPAVRGSGQPLPGWARLLAAELPATTAALLELDLAQRTRSPLPARLRAAMRWISANANGCPPAEEIAAADAKRAGVDERLLAGLRFPEFPGWSDDERAALEFARRMTLDSDSVTDKQFAGLVRRFGEHQTASMVLLLAYSNFQDRLLLCLKAPREASELEAPVDVAFDPRSLVSRTTPPPGRPLPSVGGVVGQDLIVDDSEWIAATYEDLQERLEAQRRKPTRLRIPSWDEVERNLPPGLFDQPSDIVWYRIVFGYAPELAGPFEIFMRTAGAEGSPRWDRILGGSLFWITTLGVKCPYCMGHCEMNWEVAGLNTDQIARRSRLLGGDDWSSFSPAEQQALAFARKLTKSPGKIVRDDIDTLCTGFGPARALLILLNSSRYHYMTRISNGFQLTLERENVFYEFYHVTPPAKTDPLRAVTPAVPLLSEEECWRRMPRVITSGRPPLPNWVRGVAEHLPRTAAAMLQLDFAHRSRSPLDPVLRGKLRWVIAKANRCAYSQAYAAADLTRTGVSAADLQRLTGDPAEWTEEDREPLEFARLLTVAAPTIPDDLFARLRDRFGDKGVASMVLLAAYGNFQDRVVLGLNLPLEQDGPLPPLDIRFADDAFQAAPFVPASEQYVPQSDAGVAVVAPDETWGQISYDELQSRLERQRRRQPRLPVPTWEEVRKVIPPAMAARPTRIVWNLVSAGYVPELAVPWSIATRTMWAETKPDRIFEESLFWVQTRSIECNYCMGHCEMLLEVAGLDRQAIADRTRRLAAADWSSFPAAEQRAYAYARKLSQTPWELTPADYRLLEADLGRDKALATFWWLCRGLYMTRVSDGFQLPLEQENVFQPLPAAPSAGGNSSK